MASIIVPPYWTRQPPLQANINYVAGLQTVIQPTRGKFPRDSGPLPAALTYAGSTTVTQDILGQFGPGFVYDFPSSGSAITGTSIGKVGAGNALSFVLLYKPITASGGVVALVNNVDTSAGFSLYQSGTELQLDKRNTAAMGTSSGAALTLGIWHCIGFTYDGTNIKFFKNGRLVSSATSTQSFTQGTGVLGSGGQGGALRVGMYFDFNVAVNDSQMRLYTANPWALYGPLPRKVWVNVAAALGGFQPAWAANSNQILGVGTYA